MTDSRKRILLASIAGAVFSTAILLALTLISSSNDTAVILLYTFIVPVMFLDYLLTGHPTTAGDAVPLVFVTNVLVWTAFFLGIAWLTRKRSWATTIIVLTLSVAVVWLVAFIFLVPHD